MPDCSTGYTSSMCCRGLFQMLHRWYSKYFTFLYFVWSVILGAEYSILCYLSKFSLVHIALPVTETSWLCYTHLFFLCFALPCNCAIHVFLRKDKFSETPFLLGQIFLRICEFTDLQRKQSVSILLFLLIPFTKMKNTYFLVSAIFSLHSLYCLQSNGNWTLFYLFRINT